MGRTGECESMIRKKQTRTLETAGCGTRNLRIEGHPPEKTEGGERWNPRTEEKADPSHPFAKRADDRVWDDRRGLGQSNLNSVRGKQGQKSQSPTLAKSARMGHPRKRMGTTGKKAKRYKWAESEDESQRQNLVDVTGIEPATPCLQSRCSPS